jgi:hypothetical protein
MNTQIWLNKNKYAKTNKLVKSSHKHRAKNFPQRPADHECEIKTSTWSAMVEVLYRVAPALCTWAKDVRWKINIQGDHARELTSGCKRFLPVCILVVKGQTSKRPCAYKLYSACVCVYTVCHIQFWKCFNVINMQGGQAYHIQPGPTKLGCDRGSTKERFDVYLHR